MPPAKPSVHGGLFSFTVSSLVDWVYGCSFSHGMTFTRCAASRWVYRGNISNAYSTISEVGTPETKTRNFGFRCFSHRTGVSPVK